MDSNDKKDLSLGIAYEIRKRNKATTSKPVVDTETQITHNKPIEPIKVTGSIAESILSKKAKPINELADSTLELEEPLDFADEIDSEQQDMISKLRARIKKQKILGR
jgi:hypothetical protein